MPQAISIFEHPALKHMLASRPYAEGVIFAVASSPEIPMPEEWMPWVIEQSGSHSISKDQADDMADGLMKVLRDALDAMRKQQVLLPAYCTWSENDAERAGLCEWLKGLLTGHQQLEKVWQRAWHEGGEQGSDLPGLAERLTRCLKLFSTLAEPEQAIANAPDAQRKVLADGLPKLSASLPAMLQEYVAISGELAGHLPNQFETFKSE